MADWSNSKQVGNWGSRMIVEVDLNSQSQANNTSSITVRIRLQNGGQSQARNNNGVSWSMSNGVSASGSQALLVNAGATATFVSRNFTVSHNSAGNKSMTVTAKVNATGTTTFGTPGSVSVSVSLPRIPKPPNAPSVPTTSNVGQTSATINWTAPGNNGAAINRYQIRFYRATGNAWQDHTQTGRSRTYSGLTANTTYRARVRARNAAGWGPWSGYRTFKTAAGVPSKPGKPSVSGATSNSYKASVGAPANNGASITQYQWQAGSDTFTSSGTSVTITGRNPNAQHRVRVRARNSAGWGAWSEYSNYITTNPNGPTAPTNVNAQWMSNTRITVTWTRNATTERPYASQRVQRRRYVSGSWTAWATLDPVDGNTSSYEDTSAQANNAYEYRIQAVNSAGTATSAGSLTIRTSPSAPTNVSAEKSGENIVVRFTTTFPETSTVMQEVQRRENSGYAWQTLGTTSSLNQYIHENPDPAVTHQYRVRTTVAGTGTTGTRRNGTWSEASNIVQLQAPPLAPTLINPTGVVDREEPVFFEWRHNPVDTTAQTEYELELSYNGFPSETLTGGTEEYREFETVSSSGSWNWRVRTKGEHPDWGPWSPITTYSSVTRPEVLIQNPTGAPLDKSQVSAEWNYSNIDPSGQARWEVELRNESGALLEAESGSGETFEYDFQTILDNSETYRVRVRVRSGTGLWSEWDEVIFETDFPLPAEVIVVTDPDKEEGNVTLTFDETPYANYTWEGVPNESRSVMETPDGDIYNEFENPEMETTSDPVVLWENHMPNPFFMEPSAWGRWSASGIEGMGKTEQSDGTFASWASVNATNGDGSLKIGGSPDPLASWAGLEFQAEVSKEEADIAEIVVTITQAGNERYSETIDLDPSENTYRTVFRNRWPSATLSIELVLKGSGRPFGNVQVALSHFKLTYKNTEWDAETYLDRMPILFEGDSPDPDFRVESTPTGGIQMVGDTVEGTGQLFSAGVPRYSGGGLRSSQWAKVGSHSWRITCWDSGYQAGGFFQLPDFGDAGVLTVLAWVRLENPITDFEEGGEVYSRRLSITSVDPENPENFWISSSELAPNEAGEYLLRLSVDLSEGTPVQGFVYSGVEEGDTVWVDMLTLVLGDEEYTGVPFSGSSESTTEVDYIDVQRWDGDQWITLETGLDPETSIIDPIPPLIEDLRYRAISRTDLPTARLGPETIVDMSYDCDRIFVNGGSNFNRVGKALGNATTRTPSVEAAAHQWAGWEFPQAVFGSGESYVLDFQAPLIDTSRGMKSTLEPVWADLLQTRKVVCFRDTFGLKFFGILNVSFSREEGIDNISLSMTKTHYVEGLRPIVDPDELEE